MEHLFSNHFVHWVRHFLSKEAVGRAAVCLLAPGLLLQPLSFVFAADYDPPVYSNPNLFTDQSSAPHVNDAGALIKRFPLDIPPGRSGLTPDLALQYNS